MSTGGKKGDSSQPKRPAPERLGPSRTVRILVSIALVFHLFIVFFYPLANTRTSDTVLRIANSPPFRWYADALYLNHGHNFFGPDPGAGFLVEYEVRGDDGKTIAEGTFPDADRIWPRLRYHRFKMLADQLDSPLPPAEAEQRRDFLLGAFARQLIRQHDGESATVTYITHAVVPYHEWRGDEAAGIKGKSIDDPSLYTDVVTFRQTRADVEAADARLLGPADESSEAIAEGVPQ